MPVNFVWASALLVLNSAKPRPISTQPPRRGGRRRLAHPSTVTVVACGCGLRNPSLWPHSISHSFAPSLSVVVSRWSAGARLAGPPLSSSLSPVGQPPSTLSSLSCCVQVRVGLGGEPPPSSCTFLLRKRRGLAPLLTLFFSPFFLGLKAQSTKIVSPISNLLF